jgi:chromosome segregation ATPase
MPPEQKRIENQREEIRRLQKRLQSVTQSRNAWKAKAKRLGKQLHDVLQKGANNEQAD